MMICPQCRAEYRDGFTVCADCEVALVPEYRNQGHALAAPPPPATPGDPNEDPFCSFWQGDDPRLHAEICTILDEADIPHKTVRRQDHLFNLSNYAAFQIGVPFSLFEKAGLAVKEAYELDSSEPEAVQTLTAPHLLPETSRGVRKLPPSLSPPPGEDIPGPPTRRDSCAWFPEDATTLVWSNDDPGLGEMLIASLNENEIHCRWEEEEGSCALYVLPKDAERAREIIREIEEGSAAE